MTTLTGEAKARYVRDMFGQIAGRYDVMNRLMTGFQDQAWRRLAVTAVAVPPGGIILDVGTGTGDFLPLLTHAAPGARAVGVDLTFAMMDAGRAKLTEADGRAGYVQGDALRLPFADDSFDGLVNGFLLRNVADLRQTLAEMRRVIKPGARAVLLEITPVDTPVWGDVFRVYFGRVVPRLGGMIAGAPDAYTYLPQSVERFVSADELRRLMTEVGFRDVRYTKLMLNTVALHIGEKA
jgi:demethylmenaquinone methyltransferase/2-methoxy-6-polyprenyl-1,4-benzoquinol methylase